MWRQSVPQDEAERLLARAVEFTGNAALYGSYMKRVVDTWPFSVEHNLTNTGMNRRAWVGHAAASLAIGAPEYITRQAWWMLTEDQRRKANRRADTAIRRFEERMRAGRCRNQLSLMFNVA
jgi:hypothetical protein